MRTQKSVLVILVTGVILAQCAVPACASEVQDLVRIKGHERNTLTGLGIVIGLNGTGDRGKDSLIAARPMARLLTNLGGGVSDLEELAKADAFALVQVTLVIPPTGAREGDEIDVYVEALYNAKSLRGGRLIPSMLRLPLPDTADLPPLALAQGRVNVEGENPRAGVVRMGGQVFEYPGLDFRTNVIAPDGSVTLVLHEHYASHAVASVIAASINDEFVPEGFPDVAIVEDAKNVRVMIPAAERANPANFIAAMMLIEIDPTLIRTPARVVINESLGSIVITGSIEISPVAITHDDLAITTITPQPLPSAADPVYDVSSWATFDTTPGDSRSSARLDDLVRAFEQLNVPAKTRIAILYQLKEAGALHAEIIKQ
ncbi:MAG: flagellar basal body P-ring protein FlgI [Phycisphaerales bacterium]